MKQSDLENAIDNNQTELIGQGEWVKDSCYRVYKYQDRYFAVIVIGQQNLEFLENSIIEISEDQIKLYI